MEKVQALTVCQLKFSNGSNKMCPNVVATNRQVQFQMYRTHALERWRNSSLAQIRHTSTCLDNFRSTLADFSLKISYGLVRQRILPALETYKVSMQAGGVPGAGTDMVHLFVQSFSQQAKYQIFFFLRLPSGQYGPCDFRLNNFQNAENSISSMNRWFFFLLASQLVREQLLP